jgi:hypothetical protein
MAEVEEKVKVVLGISRTAAAEGDIAQE